MILLLFFSSVVDVTVLIIDFGGINSNGSSCGRRVACWR